MSEIQNKTTLLIDESLNKSIENFKTQIKKTLYCRINAYKRCLMWDSFYKVIACIYNLAVIALSILMLIFDEAFLRSHIWFSALLVVAAVCTFALDLFLRVINYGSKADQYKSAYNEIENILTDLDAVTKKKELFELNQRYETLIKYSINHDEQDYCRYAYENCQDDEFHNQFKSKYRWYEARDFLVKCGFSFTIYFFVWLLKLCVVGVLLCRDKIKDNTKQKIKEKEQHGTD